jgi:YegS/Rv2252/BmrU family lipid kinase
VNIGVLAHPKKSMDAELGDLRTALSRRGIGDPPWRETTEGDDAPRLVGELLDRGVDRLLIWGGDGTVRGCIDAVSSAPVTLAIMPAGTANLLATNLGIPTELEAALDVALSGRRRRLDVGTVNGERFSVMAGVGFDALMIRRADAGLKDKLGRLAYVAAGVGGVGRSAVDTRVEIDGETWFEGAATCVLAGNMGDVLGGIAAFPQAEPDDGRLDVGVITADGALDWVRTLGRTISGDPASSPFVDVTTARRLLVSLDEPLPYELDGEARQEVRSLELSVEPAAIAVCVPRQEDGR